MKNTQKDRFEKKLIRFIREWYKKQSITDWQEFSATLYKKYGFTDKELHKAIRLTMSVPERKRYVNGIGYKKSIQMKKDKSARRAEQNGTRAQYSDEQLEAQLKAEDDWIMDVFDSYYDEEDMQR